MNAAITAIAPWFDAMEYALSLLRDGTLIVDNQGRIWRHYENGRWGRKGVFPRRAEHATRKGYLAVCLGIPGSRTTCKVQAHRLIWFWKCGPIEENLQINHKNLRKDDNRLENLELVTASENIRHSYANGRQRPWSKSKEWRPGIPRITAEKVQEVMVLHAQGLGSHRINKLTGISRTHIERLIRKGGEQCK